MTSTNVAQHHVTHATYSSMINLSKSNVTGKEYKTISYDTRSCGSTNVIYRVYCVHCGLVYVGETGRSLGSRMNGHRSAVKKKDKAYSTDNSINQIILQMT